MKTTPKERVIACQAVLTKYVPATNVRGSRIKASCDRGSVTISYPYELSGADCHAAAVRALVDKFVADDVKRHGPDAGKYWSKPFVTGVLPSGDYCHVFVD